VEPSQLCVSDSHGRQWQGLRIVRWRTRRVWGEVSDGREWCNRYDPEAAEFWNGSARQDQDWIFKVTDTGKGDLHITLGTLTAPFQVQGADATNVITLTKGQVATVSVGFVPTGTGSVSQILTLSSDDSNHPSQSVNLMGVGK
jgi:hypothetical protein